MSGSATKLKLSGGVGADAIMDARTLSSSTLRGRICTWSVMTLQHCYHAIATTTAIGAHNPGEHDTPLIKMAPHSTLESHCLLHRQDLGQDKLFIDLHNED